MTLFDFLVKAVEAQHLARLGQRVHDNRALARDATRLFGYRQGNQWRDQNMDLIHDYPDKYPILNLLSQLHGELLKN